MNYEQKRDRDKELMKLDFFSVDDCTDVTWHCLPKRIKDLISKSQLKRIIELEEEYLEKVGIIMSEEEFEKRVCDYPLDLDEDEMQEYILKKAIQEEIILRKSEHREILDAELEYYFMCDAAGEMDIFLN